MSELQDVVTRNVRVLMAIRGITEDREVARMIGVDASTISYKLRGRRQWSLDDIEKLAHAFDVPASTLLGDAQAVIGPALATGMSQPTYGSVQGRTPACDRTDHVATVIPFPSRTTVRHAQDNDTGRQPAHITTVAAIRPGRYDVGVNSGCIRCSA
jgi:transcriptional regulator with XRE-family HTH domain